MVLEKKKIQFSVSLSNQTNDGTTLENSTEFVSKRLVIVAKYLGGLSGLASLFTKNYWLLRRELSLGYRRLLQESKPLLNVMGAKNGTLDYTAIEKAEAAVSKNVFYLGKNSLLHMVLVPFDAGSPSCKPQQLTGLWLFNLD